jgi:hypothetical protein
MAIIAEIFASIVRIFLLFFGVAFSFTLGNTLYNQINSFLYSISLPCIELISFLVVLVPPVALYFGIHHKRYFWQRENRYNVTVLLVSFLVGFVFTILPFNYAPSWVAAPQCAASPDLLARFLQVIGTGLVTALFAYIGMDLGVSLKHLSHHVHKKSHKKHHKHHTHQSHH